MTISELRDKYSRAYRIIHRERAMRELVFKDRPILREEKVAETNRLIGDTIVACYPIHFTEPYRHAKHYLGWSPEVQARVNAQRHGKGTRLTHVVIEAGISVIWVRV